MSELGWDLSIALKGLSLGNGINKGYFQAPPSTVMWQFIKENREGIVVKLLCLRTFKYYPGHNAGHPWSFQAVSQVLPGALYHTSISELLTHSGKMPWAKGK